MRRFLPVFLALTLATLFLAACGGDDDGSPGATATRPASPGPSASAAATQATAAAAATPAGPADCPVSDASLCGFAASVQASLQKGSVDPVIDATERQDVTCKGADTKPTDATAAVCKGKAAGEVVTGYLTGTRNSEGGFVSRAALSQVYARWGLNPPAQVSDDYGGGLLRLMTIGSPSRDGCTGCHVLVYSWIEPFQPGDDRYTRKAFVLDVEKLASWKISLSTSGVILPSEADAILLGGTYEGRTYQRWNPADGTKPAGTGGIYFGKSIAVAGAGECVNDRAAPLKTAAVLDCLADGTKVTVVGGPRTVDGTRWWRVLHPNPGVAAGWIAADNLK
ncbi:MAG: hypothetical protein HYX53_15445 [Chloroflexi bacterium]|nr:hypothetical protein [Chloroflexota bacterium]